MTRRAAIAAVLAAATAEAASDSASAINPSCPKHTLVVALGDYHPLACREVANLIRPPLHSIRVMYQGESMEIPAADIWAALSEGRDQMPQDAHR